MIPFTHFQTSESPKKGQKFRSRDKIPYAPRLLAILFGAFYVCF